MYLGGEGDTAVGFVMLQDHHLASLQHNNSDEKTRIMVKKQQKMVNNSEKWEFGDGKQQACVERVAKEYVEWVSWERGKG